MTEFHKLMDKVLCSESEMNQEELRMSNAGPHRPGAQASITRMSQQKAYVVPQRGTVGLTPSSRRDMAGPHNDIDSQRKKQRTPDPVQPPCTLDTTSPSFIHGHSLDLVIHPLPRHYCTYCS